MTCGIYLITNNITGKQYIGQSIHIEKRIREHQYKRDLKTSYLENSIQKYGWENFSWSIIYECEPDELDIEERKFIKLYNTFIDGYNLTYGGELSGYGNPMHNPEIAKRNACNRKGFKHSTDTKLRISKNKNKTGFYRVFKEVDDKLSQGFTYRYEFRKDNKKHGVIRSINIRELEEKVKSRGLDWIIINEELASETLKESDFLLNERNKNHPTGYYNVIKHKDPSMNQGFIYRYSYFDGHGKAFYIENKSLLRLEEKVLAKGLKWLKLNDNLGLGEQKTLI